MKNPWLSMWMSGANAWGGAARGMMAAETKRAQNNMMAEAAKQQSAMMTEAAKRMTEMWFPGMAALAPSPAKRKRRRRS